MRFLKVTTAPMSTIASTPAMAGPTNDIVVGPSWCVVSDSAAEASVLTVASASKDPELLELAESLLEEWFEAASWVVVSASASSFCCTWRRSRRDLGAARLRPLRWRCRRRPRAAGAASRGGSEGRPCQLRVRFGSGGEE